MEKMMNLDFEGQ